MLVFPVCPLGPTNPDHPPAVGYSHGSWTQTACQSTGDPCHHCTGRQQGAGKQCQFHLEPVFSVDLFLQLVKNPLRDFYSLRSVGYCCDRCGLTCFPHELYCTVLPPGVSVGLQRKWNHLLCLTVQYSLSCPGLSAAKRENGSHDHPAGLGGPDWDERVARRRGSV